MKLMDLSGQWDVTIDDGQRYQANLPGTLDENGIGYTSDPSVTRLARAYTYEGSAVFSRDLTYRKELTGNRVFLEIERSRKLSLRVNGHEVEPYCSGTVSTPYLFELTNCLVDHNRMELICDNSYQGWPHDAIVYSSAATDETQTNWNGILGTLDVRLEKEVFISNLRVYPRDTQITVIAEIDAAIPYKGVLRLASSALEVKVEQEISIGEGIHTIEFHDIQLNSHCKRWDEYQGNLYELVIAGNGLESKTVSFGIRDFGDNGSGRFHLNGRTIFLRGETNCCVFPETGHMPFTVNEWVSVLELYKSYGVNCVRFHSHCPPDAAFTAADQLGILMQPELSHWNPSTALEEEESFSYYQLELKQILLNFANHPSFVMLTLGNELNANELGHQRMDELLTMAKKIDSTRLYANGSNVHYGAMGADENSDFYTASGFYDKMLRGTSSPMIGHINESYPNAKTNYDSVIEEIRNGYFKPVFSFEVGQYEVLPEFDEIADFARVTLPTNLDHIKERVIQSGYLADWKKRIEATGELAKIAYREEIEAALRTKNLSGISLLGLQDFPGQGTALVGMLNSHLKPKPYAFACPEAFRAFFCEVLPLVLLEKYTYTNQETLSSEIEIANYGKQTLHAKTEYELRNDKDTIATGILPAVVMPPGEVTVVGRIAIPLTDIIVAQKMMLRVVVGEYKNEYPIWVYPDNPMVSRDVIITKTFLETKEALEKGRKVFYSPCADETHFPNSIPSQFTTDFWSVGTFANQSGCMGCLIDSSHPVFSEFPTETHSNWQWWPMSKGRAMVLPAGVQPIITVLDCYARLRHLAFLFECKVGEGTLMVSSMGLYEKLEYPEVRALTNSILTYMNSEKFSPKQKISVSELENIISGDPSNCYVL